MDRDKKLHYLRAGIVLVAVLCMIVCDLKTGEDLTIALLHILIVIIVFYIIGDVVVWVINSALNMPSKEAIEAAEKVKLEKEQESQENEEGSEQEESEQV